MLAVMGTPSTSAGAEAARYDAQVQRATRLLHRRHGWLLTVLASVGTFLITTLIMGNGLLGTAGWVVALSSTIVIVTVVLIPVGLVAIAVETLTLRRYRDPELRSAARNAAGLRPGRPMRERLAPRHWLPLTFIAVVLVSYLGLALSYIPSTINSFGYLAGAGTSETFVPQTVGQVCGGRSCWDVTHGYLETPNGRQAATWPTAVPLGKPFSVRTPLIGGDLAGDRGNAWVNAVLGLLLIGSAGFVVVGVPLSLRRRRRRRRAASWLPN
jgi:hypothetical protein